MSTRSSGLLLWRRREPDIEVFIAHMGGPLWVAKDNAAWSIPKGELEPGESPLAAAYREFAEEIGVPAPANLKILNIGEVRYKSGKIVSVFAAEAPRFTVDEITGNTFELEWPPHSGRVQKFPEVDKAQWMPVSNARWRLVAGQRPALDKLLEHLQPKPA